MDGETNVNEMKYPEYEGWLDENEERFFTADLMPNDGPEHQVNSSFQVRRRVQITLLREMFANCFPGFPPLTRVEAKRMLQACHNSATDVATYIAHCASYQHRDGTVIDKPAWYILETINGELNGTPGREKIKDEVEGEEALV